MAQRKVHRIPAEDVKPGDYLLTASAPLGGLEVTGSYALGPSRWALDVPALKQMMQFNLGEIVIVIRKEN